MKLTPTQKEIVTDKVNKAIAILNNSSFFMLGYLTIFHGKIYDVIKSNNLMTSKQNVIAFIDYKEGKLYKNNGKDIPDKRISLDLMENKVDEIIEHLFPILKFNPN